jgi:hypothetical protein
MPELRAATATRDRSLAQEMFIGWEHTIKFEGDVSATGDGLPEGEPTSSWRAGSAASSAVVSAIRGACRAPNRTRTMAGRSEFESGPCGWTVAPGEVAADRASRHVSRAEASSTTAGCAETASAS